MAKPLGNRAARLSEVQALRTVKGRREQGCFGFEGPTLLAEAQRSGVEIRELYVTPDAFESSPLARALDAAGTPTFLIDPRAAAALSDVATPTGLLAVAATRLRPLEELFIQRAGVLLVLGDLNDPANAGTLLRSADAFGALGVVFGSRGVDPYHPKVVRGAMGALFRLRVARCDPESVFRAAAGAGFTVLGLRSGGTPLGSVAWPARSALVVGHERRGLERWEAGCERLIGIPIDAGAESLNAAIAGSIALYTATAGSLGEPPRPACQDSVYD
ncbi:MAG TPA: RNA methyltransferase [Candidatus Tumulicola sp.]|jgi:TrmH family RNA methyltransferase